MTQPTTASELAQYIGRTGVIVTTARPKGFRIPIKIVDVRQIFNRREVQIAPLHGFGQDWVNVESILIDPEPSNV